MAGGCAVRRAGRRWGEWGGSELDGFERDARWTRHALPRSGAAAEMGWPG